MNSALRIGIVGPCSSGKSTLIAGLKLHGYSARHIVQEHSYVPYMWERIANPDLLIYLDVSYTESMNRKKLDLSPSEFDEQVRRLHHAREHSDLYIMTDGSSTDEILGYVLAYIHGMKLDNLEKGEYNA